MNEPNATLDYQAELETAIDAVSAAEAVINRYYRRSFNVTTKADSSPVTQADIEAEQVIREHLISRFPDYGFYGEETGSVAVDAEYLWLVDPIDGTKSFVRGSPYFSTQIALMHRGRIVVGVSNAPASDERATATLGHGAFLNADAVRSSGRTDLATAFLSSGNIRSLAADSRRWTQFGELLQQVARTRGYGDFCHYHQLSCGQADIVIESDVNILDIAALSLVVTEAGGAFTDLDGNAIGLDTTSVMATATPALHATVMALLNPSHSGSSAA